MPDPIRKALQDSKYRVPDTSARQRREEPEWNEYSVLAYDGLMPTQIVRRLTDEDGIDRWEATCLPFRVDARPDTDDRRNDKVRFLPDDPTRYVDERRYVVDPMVGKHRFLGLWTGGPVRMTTDKKSGGKEVTQVLTRTFCAGHGYTTDEHGNYVCVYWVNGGFNTKRDGAGEELDPDKVRDYLTADEALKYHRPALGSRLSPYMMYRPDIPASYTREVQWREFTHESIQFLDPLGLKPENHPRLAQVVTFHFYELAGESVTNAACRIDPETNTVIFTAALTYSALGEPETPEDLFRLPCLETCDRDTLRMFGWNDLRNGEGYRYTHMFRWPRLKDSPTTRATLEFLNDNALTNAVEVPDGSDSDSDPDEIIPASESFVLGLLVKHGMLPGTDGTKAWHGYENPRPAIVKDDNQLDNTGRLVTSAAIDGSDGSDGDGRYPVQTYRVAKQRVEPDQDGSLSFVVALVKAEWHGGDDGKNWENGGRRVLAGVSAPQGYGKSETRVITAVPRNGAIPTMNAIRAADSYELITAKRQTEGQEGSSDVSFEKRKLYDYLGSDGDHTPDYINIDNNPYNATTYHYDPNTNTYTLDWNYVNPEKTQELVDKARAQLGGNPIVTVTHHPDGYDIVHIVGKGRGAQHIDEWLVEADWFKHETLEQWIGVTLIRENGRPTGFKYRPTIYKTDPTTGEEIVDWEATNAQPFTTILFDAIRGDLDANWMGSDPQAVGPAVRDPKVYITTGMEPGGKIEIGGSDSDSDIWHADVHGDGWNSGTWTDPDDGATVPPASSENDTADGQDKMRSHCMTRIGRQVNSDGTYNITVTRIYPHQRYWTWETEGENRDGDTRTVYHFAYVNWPSRKAIQTDIIEKIKTKIGQDQSWDDGWTLGGSIRVNEFGLVNAPGLTLAPAWSNDGANIIRRAKTHTNYLLERIIKAEKTYTAPSDFANSGKPADGFWWREVTMYIYSGTTSSSQQAMTEYKKFGGFYDGSKGCRKLRGVGVNADWEWHDVYRVEYGDWKDTKFKLPEGPPPQGGDGVANSENEYDVADETTQEALAMTAADKLKDGGGTTPTPTAQHVLDKWNSANPNYRINVSTWNRDAYTPKNDGAKTKKVTWVN